MSDAIDRSLSQQRRHSMEGLLPGLAVLLGIIWACGYGGAFEAARYHDALSTLLTLAADATPPDFTRWLHWGKPLLETLSMSVAGTVAGALVAVPLGILSARNLSPVWICGMAQLLLNIIRSIPDLVWGVMFVAAVGFGPLPGILALACNSIGMLGKFYAEIIEHVDPAPGLALRGQGVSAVGVIRFAVLPQILPRLVDVTLYRWEHNLRAATVLGVIGAGGLGLELITAFHLFEYREALALIIVMLILVSFVHGVSTYMRGKLV